MTTLRFLLFFWSVDWPSDRPTSAQSFCSKMKKVNRLILNDFSDSPPEIQKLDSPTIKQVRDAVFACKYGLVFGELVLTIHPSRISYTIYTREISRDILYIEREGGGMPLCALWGEETIWPHLIVTNGIDALVVSNGFFVEAEYGLRFIDDVLSDNPLDGWTLKPTTWEPDEGAITVELPTEWPAEQNGAAKRIS